MKIGDTVTPKDFPDLKGKIVKVAIDFFDGSIIYVLESGARFLESHFI